MKVYFPRLSFIAVLLAMGIAAPTGATQPVEGQSLSGTYLAGRSASKLRDNDLAADYLRQALELDAANPVLIERLFLLELAEGEMEAAAALARKVLGFNSQHRMARIVIGLGEFRERRYGAARRDFAAAAYTPVGELTSALLIAWSHAGEGDLNLALRELDKLDSNDSFANFKSLHGGLIADFLGNSIRAEAFYRKAYEQAGTSLRIVQAYGNFLARNGRGEEARKIYGEFLAGGEDHPLIAAALADLRAGKTPESFIRVPAAGAAEALFSLASAMTDDQNIDVGLLYARLALTMTGDQPIVATLLGDIYSDIEQSDRSIDAYASVPEASPLRSNAEMQIAVNLQRLDRRDEAIAKLQALIFREPANYNALLTLGNIYRNNQDYVGAGATYERAIGLIAAPQRSHWRVYYYAGIAFERQKQWDKAEKFFRRSLELSPDEPMVLNYLGYSMVEKKINLNEALEMIRKAVELKPNDGYIVDSLGWAFYQLGDYEQALVHCERAVELLPADPIIGEHLGDVYWRMGRKLEAKFQWQHAKDNKPEPEDLKRIEDKLINGLADEPPVTPAQSDTAPSNG